MDRQTNTSHDRTPLVGSGDRGSTDPGRVGAKAAVLAELRLAGFPVPHGVSVPVDAFDPDDGQLRHAAAERLRDLVSSALGPGPFAVRSSGVSEDGAESSFAGQFDTLLDVPLDGLHDAVVQCHRSRTATRVVAYADGAPLELAVLIQPMVAAEASGVAFTRDPVTGADHVVVEAVRGLGEGLVSGRATPQQWIVDSDASVATADRAHHHDSAESGGTDGPLDTERALAVADLARRVAAARGAPQDIEWAWSDGSLWLLQARPITAIGGTRPSQGRGTAGNAHDEQIPVPIVVPPGDWTRDDFHEPEPISPFGRVLLTEQIIKVFPAVFEEFGVLLDRAEIQHIGGWLYMRMVPLGAPAPRAGRTPAPPPRWLFRMLLRVHPRMRRRIRAAQLAVAEDRASAIARQWTEQWKPEHIADLGRKLDLASLDDSGLTAELDHRILVISHPAHLTVTMAYVIPMYELYLACRDLLGWDAPEMLQLLEGLSTASTEPARAMAPLVDQARSRPDLLVLLDDADASTLPRLRQEAPEFAAAVDAHLAEFGHRVLRYDVIEPTLAEVPHLLLHLIAQQARSGFDAARADAEAEARRAAAATRARSILTERASASDRQRFEQALVRARDAYPLWDDRVVWTFFTQAALLRYCGLEIGTRLTARGQLEEPGDVFLLEVEDARAALGDGVDRRDRVRRRRGQRNWTMAHPGPVSFGPEPPDPPFDVLPPAARLVNEALLWTLSPTGNFFGDRVIAGGDSLVSGTPASAGRHTGTVRVIRGEAEFDQVEAGDVVVCQVTSPAWSIVFPTMGALVTDVGGVLSHPAIIAREFGIPCVVGTRDATSVLTTGQRVTVDGTNGVVQAA
ncbi:PEP/pyruvate-binding domain-containing protein [Agromyces sp. NPDC056523]|uniref:PEP/pyruvate-binding domain-containing protein n=1 Tax=Agromyces sp. NPDC056523 TaxID=3345850 RepID=UPI0036730DE2